MSPTFASRLTSETWILTDATLKKREIFAAV